MKYLAILMILFPMVVLAQVPKEVNDSVKKYYAEQKEILKSMKVIVCHPLKNQKFKKYADLDTEFACTTHDKLGAPAKLEEIYSWGFKLIQIVDNPESPLYYFDKR